MSSIKVPECGHGCGRSVGRGGVMWEVIWVSLGVLGGGVGWGVPVWRGEVNEKDLGVRSKERGVRRIGKWGVEER